MEGFQATASPERNVKYDIFRVGRMVSIFSGFSALWASPNCKDAAITRDEYAFYRASYYTSWLMRWIPLSLSQIFRINGTDKEQDNGHHYGAAYEATFRPHRYRRLKLLEIGIGGYENELGGRSLSAWRWYFPFARLVACDIQDKTRLRCFGTHVYQTDQFSNPDLEALLAAEKHFDIIIDDGSHINAHQIFAFKKLFAHLADGGLYVIEDVQTSYWPEYGGVAVNESRFSCMNYFLAVSHYLNACEFPSGTSLSPEFLQAARDIGAITFCHNLIIIRKDTTQKRSNLAGKKALAIEP